MGSRFDSWRRRFPAGAASDGWDTEMARQVERRARELEREVCTAARIQPDEVRRLPWTGRALAAARRP